MKGCVPKVVVEQGLEPRFLQSKSRVLTLAPQCPPGLGWVKAPPPAASPRGIEGMCVKE